MTTDANQPESEPGDVRTAERAVERIEWEVERAEEAGRDTEALERQLRDARWRLEDLEDTTAGRVGKAAVAARVLLVAGIGALVGAGFRVSWGALRDVGRGIGLDATGAGIYALVVDGLVAIAVVAVLVLKAAGAGRKLALGTLGGYTAASLLLNYVHALVPALHGAQHSVRLAPDDRVHYLLVLVASALPVLAIFLGSEMVKHILCHWSEARQAAREQAGRERRERLTDAARERAERRSQREARERAERERQDAQRQREREERKEDQAREEAERERREEREHQERMQRQAREHERELARAQSTDALHQARQQVETLTGRVAELSNAVEAARKAASTRAKEFDHERAGHRDQVAALNSSVERLEGDRDALREQVRAARSQRREHPPVNGSQRSTVNAVSTSTKVVNAPVSGTQMPEDKARRLVLSTPDASVRQLAERTGWSVGWVQKIRQTTQH